MRRLTSILLTAIIVVLGANLALSPGIQVRAAGALDHIIVTPSDPLVLVNGGQVTYSAQGYDIDNNLISGLTFTWRTTGGGLIGSITGTFIALNTLGYFPDSIHASSGGITGDADVTIVASLPNTYTVTFDNNGGSGVAPTSEAATSGQLVTAPTTLPTQSGYTLNGWNTAANGTGTFWNFGSSLMGAGSMTLYAQWTANSYTVNFDNNGGAGVAPTSESATFGQLVAAPTTLPTYPSYILSGWNTAANGTGTSWNFGSSLMGAGSMTLYYD
jgi:uncharacterized repeat protein (TIGR02543 family)